MLEKIYVWLKRVLLVVWLLAMIVFGAWIYTDNPEPVTVSFFGLVSMLQPLGLVICAMLFTGSIIGYLTCLVTFQSRALWYKRRYRHSQKKLEKLEGAEP